jgi:monovalent cation:H+ antiporter-2, CPA2 family
MHLAQARLLVAAIPDALGVRAVVAHARRVNPTLDIVVRTHSQTEHELLARYGVTESVLGELELAREMSRYALQHLHGDASEAPEVGSGLRDPRMGRGELRP